jgi:outer membrane protein assembly factor BamB
MQALPNGDLVCGTTVRGGHGAASAVGEAQLYVLDWSSKKVVFQTAPVAGATEVHALQVGSDGLVYGLSTPSWLFAFDPRSRQVTYRYDLRAYGEPAWNAMGSGLDGTIYVLLTNAILKFKPASQQVEKVADPPKPISAGVAVQGDRLYFTIGSHLWSCRVE